LDRGARDDYLSGFASAVQLRADTGVPSAPMRP
jgi:hypothetical protein